MSFLRSLSRRALAGALGAALLAPGLTSPAAAQTQSPRTYSPQTNLVEDFESYPAGTAPDRWKLVTRSKEAVPISRNLEDRERASIQKENGNQFMRLGTKNQALRMSLRNGYEFDWNLNERPYLQWEWRANQLPEGASEKGDNDTGGAVYVTYGSDWLGRPKSIKYTYSSTLPVGTTVSFGSLTAIVVASGTEGMGSWKTEIRNVAQDIRTVAGDTPPDEPLSITIWSDSDTTGGSAEVDFDDFRLMAQP